MTCSFSKCCFCVPAGPLPGVTSAPSLLLSIPIKRKGTEAFLFQLLLVLLIHTLLVKILHLARGNKEAKYLSSSHRKRKASIHCLLTCKYNIMSTEGKLAFEKRERKKSIGLQLGIEPKAFQCSYHRATGLTAEEWK